MSGASANVNVKAFFLASDSDTTTAQAAIDRANE
jgi:hypothetical protein